MSKPWKPLPPEERSAKLRAVVERCRRPKQVETIAAVVAFDLDGTLLDNRPRTAAILREFAELEPALEPKVAAALREPPWQRFQYRLSDNVRSLGVDDETLIERIGEHWVKRFFVDDTISHDIPIEGAAEFARACYDAGGTICYFTGRDLPNMALGTLASLRDHGFPIGVPGTELVLKPNFEMDDFDFKRAATAEFARLGEVVAGFDNEPGNCNIFVECFPGSDVFLLDTQAAPDPPPLDERVSVVDNLKL